MFVRTVADVRAAGRERQISHGITTATRYLTKSDGLDFSLSCACKPAGRGSPQAWYKNHWEANFIASGRGELEELSTGRRWPLEPRTVYVVGPNDRHKVHAFEDLLIVSVFNPPLVGGETHDADGAYPPAGPLPPGLQDRRMFVRTVADVRAAGHERQISHGITTATRYLTKSDGLGFSLSTASKAAGQAAHQVWYKNHWEANFIASGRGELEDLSTSQRWPLEPRTVYVVGPDDRHKVHVFQDLLIVSVFNPPLIGDETHDADGAYPPTGPLPASPQA
ncbi:ectoine synthase [Bradyrhizobium arachidis]|uniref:ectoine synthase n=1 Tax=Bradyrhizobium arachidis TaxID=858423 RepID=UPI0021613D03|nr:ectoine synthase [Bradyrhizobium arachidis]UVO30446.1 ectoine synthase [Bradyrhizobium arachidis]